LIPIFDHGDAIGEVVKGLAPHGLPCLIVDDGSAEPTRRVLDRLAAENPWIELYRRPENGGRGAALRDGYRLAGRRGFTHALQLDADGQHETSDVPRLLEAARRDPEALVLGRPIFDDSAPLNRLYGRKLSQGLVWLETLSFAITDPLCGYRCFPIAPTLQLLDRRPLGDYMDFDPEIAVRLVWRGLRVENVETDVVYREGGLSHYAPLADTLRISRAHIQLLFGMVLRSPLLIWRGIARGIAGISASRDSSESRGQG
jgi:glycosyltransferase involved in cell wall biosynthesis